jgi:hypothetical protein
MGHIHIAKRIHLLTLVTDLFLPVLIDWYVMPSSFKENMMKNKSFVVAGVLSGAVLWLAAAPAMAGVGVELNIGVPGLYAQPAYVQPAPVYVQEPRVYVESRTVYERPQSYYVEREYREDWRQRHWTDDRGNRHGRSHDGYRGRGDRDGDGVPNRYDRYPNNPYRD